MSHTKLDIPYENLGKLNAPFYSEYLKAFEETSQSGWYILGKGVEEFEQNFGRYCGVPHFAGVASGLDALIIALKVFGFKPGSEVIVPSNTYIATILSIVNNQLVPVLVEPDIRTYNIDPDRVEEAITPKTVAIMPVHLYGKCCDMSSIQKIADDRGLKVIEDAAQAHGASLNDVKAGAFGDFGAFSFYPTKNLGALGDAGGLTVKDPDLFQRIKAIRNYGSFKKYYNDEIGMNSRLDELQARFLNVKLKALDAINDHKRKLAKIYFEGLNERYILPSIDDGFRDVYHIFNIRTTKRDELKEFLVSNGIKTEIHYPLPPHRQKAMTGIISGSYPISEEIHATTLSLPISYCHSTEDVEKVIEVVNRFEN